MLSAKGRRLAVRATKELNRAVFEATGLSAARRRQLFSLLQEVWRNAGNF